jgi:hypothetical protein
LLACFPPVKSRKLSSYLHSSQENFISIDEKGSSILNSSSTANNINSISINKKQKESASLIVISDENHNSIDENIMYEINVNQNQIISLLDSDFRLPEFSPRIEDALNDEDDCIDILPEMSQELASFLMSNGFYSLSNSEYKAITQKLLFKYDILYGILNRKVETDFINKLVRYKQKPEVRFDKMLYHIKNFNYSFVNY